MSSMIIKNGLVIDPSQGLDGEHDIWIEDGKFKAIDKPGSFNEQNSVEVVDAKGAWVLPGLIDIHVHLRDPGQEYKETIETGTHSALVGGFSSVACMANTTPVNDSPYVTSFIREKARAEGHTRVYPIGAVTKGLKGEELAEIGSMVHEGVIAISDDGMVVMNTYLMRKAMDYAKAFSIPVICHAEDTHLVGQGVMNEGALSNELGLRGNPAAAEEIMVARDISLCRLTGCPLHIAHVSTALAVEHIRRAKEEGLPVTAEVCPHHLVLTEDALRTYDTRFKMAPPLRTQHDTEVLIQAVQDGVIDTLASDHAPHGLTDKVTEFDVAANGIIGMQSNVPITLGLVHEGKISRHRWVEAWTSAPAKVMNLPLGSIKKGALADVSIIDPNHSWSFEPDQLRSRSSNSPYLGWKVQGIATHTIIEGEVRHELQ